LNALHGNNWRNSAISGEGAVADPWGWRSVWLLWKWSTHIRDDGRPSACWCDFVRFVLGTNTAITRSRSAVATFNTHTRTHTMRPSWKKRFHSVSVRRVQKRWDDWNHVHCIVRLLQHRDRSVAALWAYLLNGTIGHSGRLIDRIWYSERI